MGYLESIDWKGIKKDLQKGMEKGVAAMKQGAIVVQKKAGELTEEGKRQYKVLRLKAKIHQAVTDLGAAVYALLSETKAKNPALDSGVKDIVSRIKDLKTQITAIEGKGKSARSKARKKK